MTWPAENNNHGCVCVFVHVLGGGGGVGEKHINVHIPEGDGGNLTDSLKPCKATVSSQATASVRSDESSQCWVNLGIKLFYSHFSNLKYL